MFVNGHNYCDAGRTALFNGRWPLPCPTDVDAAGRIHVIYTDEGKGPIELCDMHFDEVNRAGLISNPYAGRDFVRAKIGREP